jgi:ABC-type multidrug transport system ATPase subunit/cytochrome P450
MHRGISGTIGALVCMLLCPLWFPLVKADGLAEHALVAPANNTVGLLPRPISAGAGARRRVQAAACTDDPAGMLAALGATCNIVVSQLGCSVDLHGSYPAFVPMSTSVSFLCPDSCSACGASAMELLTLSEAVGAQKFGAVYSSLPPSEPFQSMIYAAVGPAPVSATHNCLKFDDHLLKQLRALQVGSINFDSEQHNGDDYSFVRSGFEKVASPKFKMTATGIGVYHGVDAAAEYTMITYPSYNDGFWHVLARNTQELILTDEDAIVNNRELWAFTDFSRLTTPWVNQTFKFSPCSLRIDEYVLTFAPDEGVGVFVDAMKNTPTRAVCENIQRDCTGANRQYNSVEACITYLDSLPAVDPECVSYTASQDTAVQYAAKGNTSACKFLHHFMAKSTPESHCFHSGPGLPDNHGKIKCAPSDCTSELIQQLEDYECDEAAQAELEQRVVGVLPHCLSAIASNTCDQGCIGALRQFQFLANDSAMGQMCACRRSTMLSPLSVVIARLQIDLASVFAPCVQGIAGLEFDFTQAIAGGCAGADASTDWISNYDPVGSVPQILRSIARRSHAAAANERTENTRDMLLIDRIFCENVLGGPVQLMAVIKSTFGPVRCPFSHGPIMQGYDDVRAAYRSRQVRRPTVYVSNPDLPADAQSFSFLTSNTSEHISQRRLMKESFPELSVSRTEPIDPLELIAPPQPLIDEIHSVGFNLDDHVFAKIIGKPSNQAMFLEHLVVVFTETLLKTATLTHPVGIPDNVKAAIVLFFANLATTPSKTNVQTGQLTTDIQKLVFHTMANWFNEIFGNDRLDALSQEAGLDRWTATLQIAEIFIQGGMVNFALAFPALLKRVMIDPCTHVPMFRRDPHSYVLEQLRLEHPVPFFATMVSEQLPIDFEGVTVNYGPPPDTDDATLNFSSIYSIYSANRDASVFPDPNTFNPTRQQLNRTLSFAAVEGDIISGHANRPCLGHDFALRLLPALVERYLISLLPRGFESVMCNAPAPDQTIQNCADDSYGLLAMMALSCDSIVPIEGCTADLQYLLPPKSHGVVPMGTPVSLVCPETCGLCGADVSPVDLFTTQESHGVQKFGLQLSMVPDGLTYTEAASRALSSVPTESTSHCLYVDDYTLKLLRAKRHVEVGDRPGQASSIEKLIDIYREIGTPKIREAIPGIGVYHGAEDIAEYTVLTQPFYNGGFAHILKTVNIGLHINQENQVKLHQRTVVGWSKYTRFTRSVQNTTLTFAPCTLRVDLITLQFDTGAVQALVDQMPPNVAICENIQRWCTGPNLQYQNVHECVAYLDALPAVDPQCISRDNGVDYAVQGNTSSCKFLHHIMAQTGPETHCFHAGPGMPDIHGKIKCAPSDCLPPPRSTVEFACGLPEQADFEQRLVQVLPHCLESVRTSTCQPDCVRALRQFELLATAHVTDEGLFEAPKYMAELQPMCTCREKVLQSPISTVLVELELDPVLVFGVCAEGFVGQAFNVSLAQEAGCSKLSPRPVYVQGTNSDTVIAQNILRRIADKAHAAPITESLDVNVRATLLEDEGFCEALLGGVSGRLKSTRTIAGSSRCPFSHGMILQSHADVTGALRAPQARTNAAFTAQPFVANVMSPNLPVFQPTGTDKHRAARQLVLDLLPELGVEGEQPIDSSSWPPVPASLTQTIFNAAKRGEHEDGDKDLDYEVLTDYLITVFVRCLLQNAAEYNVTNLPDEVMASIKIFVVSHNDAFERSSNLNTHSGLLLEDAVNLARQTISDWFTTLYTSKRLGLMASSAGLPDGDAVSLALVDGFLQGLVGTIGPIPSFLERLQEDPCTNVPLYRTNPLAYWKEHLRLEARGQASISMLSQTTPVTWDGNTKVYEPAEPTAAALSVILSFLGANHDSAVFSEPDTFDPSRPNLGQTVTFNALESEIESGVGDTLARHCPAHDFALRFLLAVAGQALADISDTRLDSYCKLNGQRPKFEPTWDLFTCDEGRPCFDHVEAYLLIGIVLTIVMCTVVIQFVFRIKYWRLLAAQKRLLAKLNINPRKSGGLSEPVAVPTVSFKDLYYTVANTTILAGVTGIFQPGELVAIMGPSGSGKTTLIDVLTGRRSFGRVSGHIRYDSTELPDAKKWLRKNSGYVIQRDDEAFRSLTVREVLTFSGMLKLSPTESVEARLLHIEEVIDEFGLRDLADVVVEGGEGGLSGGQRKRLAIAKEMLQSPAIVYLDEPTSGLDAASTLEVMRCLQHVASTGRTVICSIHQPRVEVFELFTSVYVLAKGEMLFSGSTTAAVSHFLAAAAAQISVGEGNENFAQDHKISTLVRAMEDAGIPAKRIDSCLDVGTQATIHDLKQALNQTLLEFQHDNASIADGYENPADMIVDTIVGPKAVSHVTLRNLYTSTGHLAAAKSEITEMLAVDRVVSQPSSSARNQLRRFCTRIWIAEVRAQRDANLWTAFQLPVLLLGDAVLYGTLFWQQDNFMVLSSLLFMSLTFGQGLNIAPVCLSTYRAIMAFEAEYRYAFMSTPAFVAQQSLHALTYGVLGVITMYVPLYWMAFSEYHYDEFVWTLVLIYGLTIFTVSFFIFCSTLFTVKFPIDMSTLMVNANVIMVLWQTFSGFQIPLQDAPASYEAVFWSSPLYWVYGPVLNINLKGKVNHCDTSSLSVCFKKNGDAVLKYYGADELNFALGPLYTLAFTVVFIVATYEILKGKRISNQRLSYNVSKSVPLHRQISSKLSVKQATASTKISSLFVGKGVVMRFIAAGIMYACVWTLLLMQGSQHWVLWLIQIGMGYGTAVHIVIVLLLLPDKGSFLIGKDRATGSIPSWSWFLWWPFHLSNRATVIFFRNRKGFDFATEVHPNFYIGSWCVCIGSVQNRCIKLWTVFKVVSRLHIQPYASIYFYSFATVS